MSIHLKTQMSLLLVTLLGLTLTCDATAATTHGKARMIKQIQSCVDEIGRRANYDEASRVVHLIESVEQEGLTGTRIGVETTVHIKGDHEEREYRISCVTDTMGKLVGFRLLESVHDHHNSKGNERS